MEQTKSGQNLSRSLRILLPWLLCAALFVFLFQKIPPDRLWVALQNIRVGPLVFWSVLYFAMVLYGDCLSLHYVFKRFVAPMRFAEVRRVRGSSFLLAVVNYLLGQAALAYYAKKKYRASLSKAFGAMSFVTTLDLLLVLSSGLLVLGFVPGMAKKFNLAVWPVRFVFLALWAAYTAWGVFWSRINDERLRRLQHNKILHWILQHNVFLIFRQASFKDYALLLLMRLPLLFVVIIGVDLAFLPFGASASLSEVFLFGPLILLVSSLPLTPAGLGTSQMLMIEFFSSSIATSQTSYADARELVFAASLIWTLANQTLKLIYGALCLGGDTSAALIQAEESM